MTTVVPYADVEKLLLGWCPTVVQCRALTETPGGEPPNDLASVLATTLVVRITRVGGSSQVGFDNPLVDFDCFGLTRPAAKAFAIALQVQVEQGLPGYFNNYGTVLSSVTVSGPSWRPWVNTNIRRFGFSSRLIVHAR